MVNLSLKCFPFYFIFSWIFVNIEIFKISLKKILLFVEKKKDYLKKERIPKERIPKERMPKERIPKERTGLKKK